MSCSVCQDKGIVTVNWADAPADYAVCLCLKGVSLRIARNQGRATIPMWQLWATVYGVPLERMALLEDVLTHGELRERGFHLPADGTPLEAVAAAARAKSAPKIRL